MCAALRELACHLDVNGCVAADLALSASPTYPFVRPRRRRRLAGGSWPAWRMLLFTAKATEPACTRQWLCAAALTTAAICRRARSCGDGPPPPEAIVRLRAGSMSSHRSTEVRVTPRQCWAAFFWSEEGYRQCCVVQRSTALHKF